MDPRRGYYQGVWPDRPVDCSVCGRSTLDVLHIPALRETHAGNLLV